MSIINWVPREGDPDRLAGFVGQEIVFDIMPWNEEADRWPWQLQTKRDLFGEFVRAARTQEEAKLVAEEHTQYVFFSLNVVPADPAAAEALRVPRDDPERKAGEERIRSRHNWLCETGWYDPAV